MKESKQMKTGVIMIRYEDFPFLGEDVESMKNKSYLERYLCGFWFGFF